MHFLTFFGIEGICIVIVSLYFAGVLSADLQLVGLWRGFH
ncbi:Uncharacterised protein [Shigella sonnei]|nr:Uncharacterised protein [Shigella sonnei]